MASAPSTHSDLNPNALPFTPYAASHDPSLIQPFPLHFHPQFPSPIPHRNPNFIPLPETQLIFPYTSREANFAGNRVNFPPVNPGATFPSHHRNSGSGWRNWFDKTPRRRNHRRKTDLRTKEANPRCNYGDSSAIHRRRILSNRNPRKEAEDSIPLKSEGRETTVMIRNIPNKYTRKLVEEFLTKHCKMENDPKGKEEPKSAFDFLYLPIDFKTKWNKGYAFVNFTTPIAARRFFLDVHNKSWELFSSNKMRDICCAKIQGKEKLTRRFNRMEFPEENFRPLTYVPARDGSPGQEVEEIPIGICIKPNKP